MVRFSYESVQDAQKVGNLLQTTVGTWGKSVPRTKEKFYAQFFNYGAYTAGHSVFNNTITGVIDDSSGDLIYDGKPFFSTSHADKVGNTYSNFSASNSLDATNMKTVYNTYVNTNNRSERGDIIELTPNVLVVPPALRFTAQEILNTTTVPYSMDRTINVLAAIVDPFVWSYLDDSDAWFLGQLKSGLMATDRQDVMLDFWQDETNLDYFASINLRYGGCITQWRLEDTLAALYCEVDDKNGVNSGEPQTGNAVGNPDPSLSGNTLEGATTRGRDYVDFDQYVSNFSTSAPLLN